MNLEEINILSVIIEDMYGEAVKSYTDTFKCVMKISGENKLSMTCMTVVNLGDRREMQAASREAEGDLKKVSKACLNRVKKMYKTKAGKALKTKEVTSDTSVELMNYHTYSEKGTALVRQVHVFEIS